MIDVVCEAFGCVPSVAERELDENYELVLDVLWARGYARAKEKYDAKQLMEPDARARLLADPMVQQVRTTEFEMVSEELARRTQES